MCVNRTVYETNVAFVIWTDCFVIDVIIPAS